MFNGQQEVIDTDLLFRLGFDRDLVIYLQNLVYNNYKLDYRTLSSLGVNYETAKELRYMYDIGTGKKIIDSERDYIAHLRRTFGKNRRIGINDLKLSKVRDVPRVAVIAGITIKPWNIYNSNNYSKENMFYIVKDIYSNRIIVETKRKPSLKFGDTKKVEGLLEIKSYNNKSGVLTLAVDKKYCRLCNRYIIVASLKRPEFHHGLIEMLCKEGTKVYVYAQTLKARDSIRYNNGTQRVYDYGILKQDIKKKLIKAASSLYDSIQCISSKAYPANTDFITVEVENNKADDSSILDEEHVI